MHERSKDIRLALAERNANNDDDATWPASESFLNWTKHQIHSSALSLWLRASVPF